MEDEDLDLQRRAATVGGEQRSPGEEERGGTKWTGWQERRNKRDPNCPASATPRPALGTAGKKPATPACEVKNQQPSTSLLGVWMGISCARKCPCSPSWEVMGQRG